MNGTPLFEAYLMQLAYGDADDNKDNTADIDYLAGQFGGLDGLATLHEAVAIGLRSAPLFPVATWRIVQTCALFTAAILKVMASMQRESEQRDAELAVPYLVQWFDFATQQTGHFGPMPRRSADLILSAFKSAPGGGLTVWAVPEHQEQEGNHAG